jgi:hypothetical protein
MATAEDEVLKVMRDAIGRHHDEGRNAGITDEEKLFEYVVDKLIANDLGPSNEAVGRAVVMDAIRKGRPQPGQDSPADVVLTDRTLLDFLKGRDN